MKEREWVAYQEGYETARAVAAGTITAAAADENWLKWTSQSWAASTAFLDGQAKYAQDAQKEKETDK